MTTVSLQSPELCRVRAITAFATLSPDAQTWPSVLAEAKRQCDRLAAAFQQGGYTVQSVRIVANPFGEYLDTSSLEAASQGLATIRDILMQLNQNGLRIRFAIGEARTAQEIALLPGLIRDHGDLSNACVNVEANADGLLDNAQILRCVEAMQEIARITPRGEGNFNFTVNFNCAPLIPYFPAGYHRSERGNCLVVGLETPDLLAAALRTLPQAEHAERMAQALDVMREALQYHAAGTVEASALLTRLFKSVKDVEAVGFSGLMLAVTEDEGLAAATRAGQFDIRALLTYSAVCGIGLDTVPIAGDTPAQKIAAIMRDTGTMAFRLNKPLTVRLFPVPGLAAGDLTRFESDDLCNCAVLAVP